MKQKKLFFNELLRRYNKYRNRFARLEQSGKNVNRRNLLEKRIASLFEKLQNLQRFIKLRTAVAATALTLCAFQPEAQAQASVFGPVQTNPFGLANTGTYVSTSSFADLDGDGDLDMISGEFGAYAPSNFHYYENTGSNTAPAFAADNQNPFGLAGIYSGYYNATKPVFVDLDHDGDFDIMAGNMDGNFYYFENTGTATAPAFAASQTNPFSLVGFTGYYLYAAPSFVDIDHDGDFDMIAGQYDGNFYYFENTGTASAPVFASPQMNPFSLTQTDYNSAPTFIDFDHDGDMDMMNGTITGNFNYYENTGTSTAAVFGAPQLNVFNLTALSSFSAPAFVDLDNDGYIDLMAGEGDGDFDFFRGVCPGPVVTISGLSSICLGSSTILTATSSASNYTWSSNAGSATTNTVNVTPSATDTTFYVTSVGTGTCTTVTKDSISITVNPLPSVTASSSAICTGSSYTITAGGADTYTYSSGSAVVTPTTTTSYTVTGVDANNCMNTAVATVTVNTLPSVVFNVSPSVMCSSTASVTLNASPAGGTYTGTAVTGSVFSPSVATAGTYTLSYSFTDANGCSNNDTAVVTVQVCTGIAGFETSNDISVYPNPSNGAFTISTSNLAANTTLVIYNGIGQVVYTQALNKQVETLNTNLAAGFYTLKIQNAQGVSTKRIVIGQ